MQHKISYIVSIQKQQFLLENNKKKKKHCRKSTEKGVDVINGKGAA